MPAPSLLLGGEMETEERLWERLRALGDVVLASPLSSLTLRFPFLNNNNN